MLESNNFQQTNSTSNQQLLSQEQPIQQQPSNTSDTSPNVSIIQPQLQSQQLFFKASLQFISKKKIDNYFLFNDDLIGQGSFAKVYKGMNILTNQIVAIKVMQLKHIIQNKLYALVEAQMEIIKSLKHPNILRCYDILITDNNCYIVTEYCENGELKNFIDQELSNNQNYDSDSSILKLTTLQHLIYDIYQGLLYLQRKNVIHRDIKMSNILVKNGKAKIADFGLASFSNNPQIFVDIKVGSPIYMAPQALLKSLYGPKTDVWAFGILLYEFFHGKTPFQHCRNTRQLEKEIEKPFEIKMITSQMSEDTKKLIFMCLSYEWQIRPSFKQLWSEQYIKSLRLKSYVSSRQLSNYKQTSMQSLRKQIEKKNQQKKINEEKKVFQSKEEIQIKAQINVSLQEQKQKKLQCNQQNQSGYSFEDFLKMSSNQQDQEVNNIAASERNISTKLDFITKVQSKTVCITLSIDDKKNKLTKNELTKNELTKNEFNSKSIGNTFDEQIENFYLQAQIMMIEQNNLSVSTQEQSTKIDDRKENYYYTKPQECKDTQKTQVNHNKITQIKNLSQNKKPHHSQQITSTFKFQKDRKNNQLQIIQFANSLDKTRKINLNKNYCENTFQFQQSLLNRQSQINNYSSLDSSFKQNSSIQIQQIYANLSELKNILTNQNVNQNINLSFSQSQIINIKTDNILLSKLKTNSNDLVHKQNLKKFEKILKSKQSVKPINLQKAKLHPLQKSTKFYKQSYNIDLVLVILEFIRFIVKYIKFTQKLSYCLQNQLYQNQKNGNATFSYHNAKQNIQGRLQQIIKSEIKQGFHRQMLYNFSQQVLMKEVSQIIFTLDTQKSSELFQIVKTHKILLNSLCFVNKGRMENQKTSFEQIYIKTKKKQQILTLFMQQDLSDYQCAELNLASARICMIGLWWSRIYDTFLLLQKQFDLKISQNKKNKNHLCLDSKYIMKQLQQFVQIFQTTQRYLKIQPQPQAENQTQTNKHEQTETLKNNINYLFQLIYQIQLKKINSIS